MQPPVPRFGGTTLIVPCLPLSLALIEKELLHDSLMIRIFTGPWSTHGSLYLYPLVPIADQNCFPVLLVPCGNVKDCCDGCVPNAMMSRMAPPALPARVGLPTREPLLPFSLPEPLMLRLLASAP